MHRSDFNVEEFISGLNRKNRTQRFSIFVCGVLIYSIAFSIFFSPMNIVTGGTTGLSLIINHLFNIDSSVTVFFCSLLFLGVGFLLLDKKLMIKTVFGVILLPIFLKFGSLYVDMLHFKYSSLFLIVFFGGIMMGFGNGLIIRSGYSVGGFQTLYQILYRYFGVSIGKSTLILNGILVLIGSYFFGITHAMYAIIGLYVSSVVTDRVMLESSSTKTFYIVTNKDKDISQYIAADMGYDVTEMNAVGGFSNQNKKVLMCAVPTREYSLMKEVVQSIDPSVFFLITDTYEIYDGTY